MEQLLVDKNPYTHNISMTVENFTFQLVDELARKKADYTKHLETYRSLRSRFEEHFFKSNNSNYNYNYFLLL